MEEPSSDRLSVDVLCSECGQLMEIKDVRAFLLGIHLADNCQATAPLRGGP